jgi:hypothetical protein
MAVFSHEDGNSKFFESLVSACEPTGVATQNSIAILAAVETSNPTSPLVNAVLLKNTCLNRHGVQT